MNRGVRMELVFLKMVMLLTTLILMMVMEMMEMMEMVEMMVMTVEMMVVMVTVMEEMVEVTVMTTMPHYLLKGWTVEIHYDLNGDAYYHPKLLSLVRRYHTRCTVQYWTEHWTHPDYTGF